MTQCREHPGPLAASTPAQASPRRCASTRVSPRRRRASNFELEGLGVSYNDVPAVREVEFTIYKNEVTALIGPSGCGNLYGSMQAFTQTNARLILGYSSVAQLGFITLGIFAIDAAGQGAQGALLQAVNHGLVVAPLFFVIALLADRAEGSEDIRDYGGIAFRAPVLAVLFLIVALATLAMPGSANFAGEFLILLGAFTPSKAIAFVASLGVILASVYALRMYIRSMHNRVGPKVTSFEMTFRDGLVLVPLVLAILAFALYPQLALDSGEAAVRSTVEAVVAR